ncbi:MAG: hypothetical protein ABS44_11750 [Chryseobacterium sp. SCN 40-13]|nr:MAG: hypothetical protein ABS44_11750 [Chryseobacterium sp. SCN 40-13]
MKALSIKQPWASLIVQGIKDIENRTWKTNFRGRIYVHASGNPLCTFFSKNTLRNIGFSDEMIEALLLSDCLINTEVKKLSAIIGEVDIIDCVINHESIWAEKSHYPINPAEHPIKPIYNWILANPTRYERPIPAKGKLSFWEPDIDLHECIWCSGKSDYEKMIQDDGGEYYCPECWEEAKPILQAERKEYCPECSIGLNSRESEMCFCQNCKASWNNET